jgi:hypothetical protein
MHATKKYKVTANVVSSSPILVTLMMEALSFSKTSVLTRATQHNIPEDAIFSLNESVYGMQIVKSHISPSSINIQEAEIFKLM